MAATHLQRSGYGIFVRFRRSRLTLRRGIVRVEDALALAEELRASRFHDRGDIFVVKEPEGIIVAEHGGATEARPATPDTAAEPPVEELLAARLPPASPDLVAEPEGTVLEPDVPPSEAPAAWIYAPSKAATPGANGQPPRTPRLAAERAFLQIFRLMGQLEAVRRELAQARAAHERLERAFAATEATIWTHGGGSSDALRRNHERLGRVRDSAVRTMASFERVATLIEQRLEAAWAEATLAASRQLPEHRAPV